MRAVVFRVPIAVAAERGQRDRLAELAFALVVVELRPGKSPVATGLAQTRPLGEPGAAAALVDAVARQRVAHVHAARDVRQPLPRLRREVTDEVTLSRGHRDHVVADAAAREYRHLDRAGRGLEPQHVAELDAEPLGALQAELGPAVP